MPLLLKPAWPQRLDYLNRRTEAHSIRTRLAMCRSMGDPWRPLEERRGCLPCPALPCCQGRPGWVCFFFAFDRSLSACVNWRCTDTTASTLSVLLNKLRFVLFGCFFFLSLSFFLPFIWQGWMAYGQSWTWLSMKRNECMYTIYLYAALL